jgi:UDP-2,3-diacylglucosamine pyrophosphatase LpxH
MVPPRAAAAAAALAELARRLPVSMVGGNHDRWGRPWWSTETAVRWSAGALDLDHDGLRIRALHGDGLAERPGRSTWTHRLISLPLTASVFGALPPSAGLWLVDRAAPLLSEQGVTPAVRAASAERQRRWARRTLRETPAIDLLVMGHTHVPALEECAPGRYYLNPGAWVDDQRYAVVTREGTELRTY